jgi:hypothetical protein
MAIMTYEEEKILMASEPHFFSIRTIMLHDQKIAKPYI